MLPNIAIEISSDVFFFRLYNNKESLLENNNFNYFCIFFKYKVLLNICWNKPILITFGCTGFYMFTNILPISKSELFNGIQKSKLFPGCPIATTIEYTNGTRILNWYVQKYISINAISQYQYNFFYS